MERSKECTPDFIYNIDWNEFNKQRLSLCYAIDTTLSNVHREDLQKLLLLLDSLQDYAITDLKIPQEEIYE